MTEQEWRRRFSIKLSILIRKSNITRRELADKANICESSLSFYLSCKKTPNFRSVINLAYALGCTIEELIDFGEQKL